MSSYYRLNCLLGLVVIFLSLLPAYAQSDQDPEQRRHDVETIRNFPDPGSDMAYVVATKANMRAEPKLDGRILRQVERGEALALVERFKTGSWYRVIHVPSADEGYIHESVVVLKLTANRYNAPPLSSQRVAGQTDPSLEVTNLERETDLNLRINGALYVVRAGSTITMNLEPGEYEYYGWSPGVRPAIGKNNLTLGYKYSWTFRIVRR
ncbi:MAG: SH3 domain-containing protein [Aridibacter famidurans]|nr:SH3 domain-containing protein [Aridibacter famidurans]